MPDTLDDLIMQQPPTADRPLAGQTLLVVEDSRYTCEAIRMICQRSGARVRRADCLASAARHLRAYRPSVALVDLGLPDGSGLDLIARLGRGEPRLPVILAMSGDDTLAGAARAAGADGFVSKPIESITAFQGAVLAHLPADQRPAARVPREPDFVVPDRIALRDDLARAATLLGSGPDGRTAAYLAAFLGGVGKSSDDDELSEAARRFARGGAAAAAEVAAVVRRRIDAEHAV